jgi:hypothetical protein
MNDPKFALDNLFDREPTHENVRNLAFACALFLTYPDTLKEETEQSFLNVFWTRMNAEYPDASAEDIEWASNLLHHMRDHGFTDEQMDVIAKIASLDLLEAEEDTDG